MPGVGIASEDYVSTYEKRVLDHKENVLLPALRGMGAHYLADLINNKP